MLILLMARPANGHPSMRKVQGKIYKERDIPVKRSLSTVFETCR
jgi:hypothetical protein